jgi:hypothetical protein
LLISIGDYGLLSRFAGSDKLKPGLDLAGGSCSRSESARGLGAFQNAFARFKTPACVLPLGNCHAPVPPSCVYPICHGPNPAIACAGMKKRTSGSKVQAGRTKQRGSEGNYKDPQLRERLKNTIMNGSKGGKPGQWSARKAQLLAAEYKKAGGKYIQPKRTEPQKHLQEWTREEWTTSDQKRAIRPGGTRRYLPKEAWSKLGAGQKKATNRKKVQGSRRGKQVVSNTRAASRARRVAAKKS